METFKNIDKNIQLMQTLFKDDTTFKTREISCASDGRCVIFFCDGMVKNDIINESIITPITRFNYVCDGETRLTLLQKQHLQSNDIKRVSSMDDILGGVLYGDTVLFCNGCSDALVINTKGFQTRAISEPGSEQILGGPREGFTEAIMVNVSLVRRKIKSHTLKFKFIEIGKKSRTNCAICYIDDVVDKNVLKEVERRLAKIDIDCVLDSNYVREIISENAYSPVKTIGTTERPDVVASKLLEGRVAIMVDGTPMVLTAPYVLIEQVQSSEDYYLDFYFASFSRFLRILGFFCSVLVLPLYIALVTFHPEILPTPLLLSISEARNGVPLPTVVEGFALLFVFEILREAATRTPTVVGQTLGIVGALVLGQAAVEARFVSAPIVIIVAFSGITGLMLPKLRSAVVLLRIFFAILASAFGLFGIIFGALWSLILVCSMYSFGIPVISNITTYKHATKRDSMVRSPWKNMKMFGRFLSRGDKNG